MSGQLNLKDKSPMELKAIAYDLSETIQQYSQALNLVNEEIRRKKAEEQANQAKAVQSMKEAASTKSKYKDQELPFAEEVPVSNGVESESVS